MCSVSCDTHGFIFTVSEKYFSEHGHVSLVKKFKLVLDVVSSINLWYKQGMLHFLPKEHVGSNGRAVLFKNEEGHEAGIPHTVGWQWICRICPTKELPGDQLPSIQGQLSREGRTLRVRMDLGLYKVPSLTFLVWDSGKEMCKDTESMQRTHQITPSPRRKLSVLSQNHCKSCLLHLESISGYNLILWPANFVTLFWWGTYCE